MSVKRTPGTEVAMRNLHKLSTQLRNLQLEARRMGLDSIADDFLKPAREHVNRVLQRVKQDGIEKIIEANEQESRKVHT